MRIRQVRNATLLVDYAGKRFLVDPFLAEKGAYPGFPGSPNSHLSNPLVGLPLPVAEIVDVDAVIVTHLHPDHWDEAAKTLVPKHLPVFAQNEKDAASIRGAGFTDVRVLTQSTAYDAVTLIKTPGQHGSDAAYERIGARLGEVCGIVFKHSSEKTLYIAGDTVWNRHVEQSLEAHAPDVVVLNCGDAQIIEVGSIIMTKEDVEKVHRAAPNATLVASHMEALNHCMLSRRELRAFAQEKGMAQSLLVPEDGEAYDV